LSNSAIPQSERETLQSGDPAGGDLSGEVVRQDTPVEIADWAKNHAEESLAVETEA